MGLILVNDMETTSPPPIPSYDQISFSSQKDARCIETYEKTISRLLFFYVRLIFR